MAGEFPTDVYGNGFFHRNLQYSGELCDVNVIDTARQDPELSTFVQLIEAAGLVDLFLCAGPFTALVPNNNAFSKLDPSLIDYLLNPANIEELQDLLLYHLLPGAVFSYDLQPGSVITLIGETVDVQLDPIRFNNAEVLEADIAACNGVIHIIDKVLLELPSPKHPCHYFWCW